MSIKVAKYRPVLTEHQILHILALAKQNLSPASISIIATLSPFQAKIENKAVSAAYVPTGRANLLDTLGGSSNINGGDINYESNINAATRCSNNSSTALANSSSTDTSDSANYGTMGNSSPVSSPVSGCSDSDISLPDNEPTKVAELMPEDFLSNKLYWEHCYNKYIATPELCTIREIEASQEHRYINDMMTPEEEADFEGFTNDQYR